MMKTREIERGAVVTVLVNGRVSEGFTISDIKEGRVTLAKGRGQWWLPMEQLQRRGYVTRAVSKMGERLRPKMPVVISW